MLWRKFSETTSGIDSARGVNEVQRVGTVSENSLIGGRVIGIDGVCFSLMACTHGYGMGNIYDDRFVIVEDFYKNRPVRIYEDYAPCLRSERTGLKVGIIKKENTQ